ncbi:MULTISPECIES: fimbria/pilus periplasmic chaperone [Rhodomicrobium]|uniref:fimbrial biogenesis chaperone n=1 Tax=Rhodomicrobium TaxID=1068 RepID=UPI001482AFF8|nr:MULTISPECIES: fimbria/pilus periplasmic chaperone [Rhodomicrobium]
MSIEPMLLEISSSGRTTQQSFKVVNDGPAPLPIEIQVSKFDLGLDGEQKLVKVADGVMVYPVQAMIPPGASQVFRVQWIGDPAISKSESYKLSVLQVPVKPSKGESGIQIVMSFGVTVNVSPPQGTSDLVITQAAPVTGKDGKRVASVTLKNPGNKHAYLRNATLSLTGNGWSAQLSAGEIAQKIGLGIVQPGKERRFLLPIEVPGAVSAIQASVKLQPEGR